MPLVVCPLQVVKEKRATGKKSGVQGGVAVRPHALEVPLGTLQSHRVGRRGAASVCTLSLGFTNVRGRLGFRFEVRRAQLSFGFVS